MARMTEKHEREIAQLNQQLRVLIEAMGDLQGDK
jgi:uncharacterized coiled-coil protein SlyX